MVDFLKSVDVIQDAVFIGIKYDPLRPDLRWTLINTLKGERISDCNIEDIEKILIDYYFSGKPLTKQKKKRVVKKSYNKKRKI